MIREPYEQLWCLSKLAGQVEGGDECRTRTELTKAPSYEIDLAPDRSTGLVHNILSLHFSVVSSTKIQTGFGRLCE